jgi:ribosomal protein S18 acetylase RimI-like enzyme
VLITPVAATDPGLRQLVREQQAELSGLPGYAESPPGDGVEYVAGYSHGRPVGCGGVRPLEPGLGEVTGMYVRPAYRRQGRSRLILAAVEEYAVQRGYHTLRLEMGRQLTAAIALYRGAGYAEIALLDGYADHPTRICYEKVLVSAPTSARS